MDNQLSLKDLQDKISTLEKENAYLKKLLADAGIAVPTMTEPFDPNQAARIVPPKSITDQMANRFFSYFWGRQDVYAKRGIKKNGDIGYFPQCHNFGRMGCHRILHDKILCKECMICNHKQLTIQAVKNHLLGKAENATDVIGVYPTLPDETCRFIVFDFDNHASKAEATDFANKDDSYRDEVNAVRQICKENGIPALTERSRSGRGAHIWIFFDKPIPVSVARRFGDALLRKGMESINVPRFTCFDRLLPMQDHLPPGSIGNLIALPLQGKALKEGNSAFIDENWNAYPQQWEILFGMPRLSQSKIEEYTAEWTKATLFSTFSNPNENDQSVKKPWEKGSGFFAEDVHGVLSITLADGIYVNAKNLKPRIQNQIRWLSAFKNPQFYTNLQIGKELFNTPRFIYLGSDEDGYIQIPRGLLEPLLKKCDEAGIHYRIDDQRVQNTSLDITFKGSLREEQKPAVETLLQHENGILSAATSYGKTVVCVNLIAQRRESTLILLESASLIEQWQRALDRFLDIHEELPTYTTPTGRTKKRKTPIGLLQGQHDSLTGIIDIAMVGSVCKKGEFHPLLQKYGMVIFDECHHAASSTASNILQHVKARYVYGVSATPFRRDQLHKINYMLMGPIRYTYTSKQLAETQDIRHLVYPRFTRTVNPFKHGEKMHPNDAYDLLRNNEVRDQQILFDIRQCLEHGRIPIVLTNYIEHAQALYNQIKGSTSHVFLYTGKLKKKEQKKIIADISAISPNESLILVATGQSIGEGFDLPRLDTLFLAMPISWKGIVEQFAGRINRNYEGKEDVIIYDYVDSHIPMFDNMYAKRLKAYKHIGYEICTSLSAKQQETNAIYDLDSYEDVYLRDLHEAHTEIVISSRTLNTPKVNQLLGLSIDRPELKVTIVTWTPEAYKYGKDEVRLELLSRLKAAGFKILTVEDNCERYAIIDNEIVWYGSMNLLSKADVEDNLMRIINKNIASELLEMTFSGAKVLHDPYL